MKQAAVLYNHVMIFRSCDQCCLRSGLCTSSLAMGIGLPAEDICAHFTVLIWRMSGLHEFQYIHAFSHAHLRQLVIHYSPLHHAISLEAATCTSLAVLHGA